MICRCESKSARRTTALSIHTIQNEDGTTVLNSSERLERFVQDEDGPFVELCALVQEWYQDREGPLVISNLPDFEEMSRQIVSLVGGKSGDASKSNNICEVLENNHIDNIHSLSHMLSRPQIWFFT